MLSLVGAFAGWLFLVFVITPMIVFGPIAVVFGLMLANNTLLVTGLVLSAISWGYLAWLNS